MKDGQFFPPKKSLSIKPHLEITSLPPFVENFKASGQKESDFSGSGGSCRCSSSITGINRNLTTFTHRRLQRWGSGATTEYNKKQQEEGGGSEHAKASERHAGELESGDHKHPPQLKSCRGQQLVHNDRKERGDGYLLKKEQMRVRVIVKRTPWQPFAAIPEPQRGSQRPGPG